MNRTLPCLGLAVLALASCARRSELAPEEVLRRAMLASNQLQSAAFTVDLDLEARMPDFTGSADIRLQGVLQDGGRETAFSATGQGTMRQGEATFAASASADVVSERNKDLYLYLKELTLTPPHPQWTPEVLSSLLNQWWIFPSRREAEIVPLSPDPSLLRAQAEIVSVTADKGIARRNDHDSHHYLVTIDPQKLAAFVERVSARNGQTTDSAALLAELQNYTARGELWIDAATFVVREISWVIKPVNDGAPYALTITVMLDEYNAAQSITYPTDAKPFEAPAAAFTAPIPDSPVTP